MSKNTITLGALSTTIAGATDREPGEVAKKLRANIRRNFAAYAPQWPGLEESKENRDGNRYPPMPRELADVLEAKFVAGTLETKESKAKDDEVTETKEERKARKAAKKAKKAAKAQADAE